jgi:hypothetical protein
MTGVEDMMTGVKGTTGAETTKNGIRNEGGRGVVILVTKTTTRPYGEVLQDNCRLCGGHKSAFPVS